MLGGFIIGFILGIVLTLLGFDVEPILPLFRIIGMIFGLMCNLYFVKGVINKKFNGYVLKLEKDV